MFLSFVLLISFFDSLVLANRLEIRACCTNSTEKPTPTSIQNCVGFERAEDLFGIACCDTTPFNSFSNLCCSGVVRQRNKGGSYAELCCGREVLRYDQTCCEGVVHNMINGDCCGKSVYSKLDSTHRCCNQTLTRMSTANDVCCGATVYDGGHRQICCGEQVFERSQFDSCCTLNDDSQVPYKAETHFCCNGAVSRSSSTSCCYLRINNVLVTQQYDRTKLCCRYPYDRLYPIGADGYDERNLRKLASGEASLHANVAYENTRCDNLCTSDRSQTGATMAFEQLRTEDPHKNVVLISLRSEIRER
ncbi:unnamed protein product [Caenorhabditis auriculariae]|uniref:Galaxin-like repeats domain-containing protein n=1 Tax=Caenorhabditis auriculariae TaxID=2777116 RepID=A0A8S1HGB1_9PELO|nr:unnamed protein product [Caenorhabditis auriculariae]